MIDMSALAKRASKPVPPHIPDIRSETDMSNFDEVDPQQAGPQDPSWAQPVNSEEQKLFDGFSL